MEGLLEGYRSGWPPGLSPEQKEQLGDILDSGPVAYGLDTGIWTSPMIAWIIEQEFGVQYHPGHVRKLLHELQFSVQRPHRVLTRANPTEQDRWHRYTYPRLKKNPKRKTGRLFLPMKPASVRIPRSTPPGVESGIPPEVPVTGQRKSVKILGAIELWKVRFHYQRDSVFNAETYLAFLQTLARRYRRQGAILIHDSASYHKKPLVHSWLDANGDWLEVRLLPKYSPELNPTKRLWQYTRKNGTHDRCFENEGELVGTLTRVFGEMQTYPEPIRPSSLFVDHDVPLLMRICIEAEFLVIVFM